MALISVQGDGAGDVEIGAGRTGVAAQSSSASGAPQITVLGIGNPIMGDDGIGLRILSALQEVEDPLDWVPSHAAGAGSGGVGPSTAPAAASDSAAPAASAQQGRSPVSSSTSNIRYIDGGTAGMELLPIVQEAEHLLVLDALAGPGEPGSVVTLYGDQIPRLLDAKLSPHQVGLLDLLSAARLLGGEPQEVAVVGIVAQRCELGVGLSEPVASALPEAACAARTVVDKWLDAESEGEA